MLYNLFKVTQPATGKARTVSPAISLQTAEPMLGPGIAGRSRSTWVRDNLLSFSKIAMMDESDTSSTQGWYKGSHIAEKKPYCNFEGPLTNPAGYAPSERATWCVDFETPACIYTSQLWEDKNFVLLSSLGMWRSPDREPIWCGHSQSVTPDGQHSLCLSCNPLAYILVSRFCACLKMVLLDISQPSSLLLASCNKMPFLCYHLASWWLAFVLWRGDCALCAVTKSYNLYLHVCGNLNRRNEDPKKWLTLTAHTLGWTKGSNCEK